MTAITFDTLMYAKKLKIAGFTEQQAEVQAESLKNVIDNTLATRNDIEGICSRLDRLENKVDKLEDRFDILERKVDKLEFTLTIRLGAMMLALVGILAAIIKL